MVEEQTPLTPAATATQPSGTQQLTRWLAFGTAVGIEIGEQAMQAVLVRARPAGVTMVSTHTIERFRERPAKDWGTEYHHWLGQYGGKHLSATVVLPRAKAIVRHLALPGVAKKDIQAAISYQIDALHPWGDEEVAWGWSPAGAGSVVVGLVRQATLDSYLHQFQDAGVPVAGFTFSASAIYAALRLYGPAPKEFAAWREEETGAVEVYGESAARAVFSAEFDMPAARALTLARAELRLIPEDARSLVSILPQPRNVASFSPIAYAAALAASGVSPRAARQPAGG